MADLDASAFDVSITGFDAEEVDALMNKFYSAEAVEDDFDHKKAAEDLGLVKGIPVFGGGGDMTFVNIGAG